MIIVTVRVKFDLTKVFSQSNKPVHNVMVMEKKLVKYVLIVEAMEKIKAMRVFLLKFQRGLMMERV